MSYCAEVLLDYIVTGDRWDKKKLSRHGQHGVFPRLSPVPLNLFRPVPFRIPLVSDSDFINSILK